MDNNLTPQGAGELSAAALSSQDLQELQELRAYRQQVDPILDTLRPHESLIAPLLQDEGARKRVERLIKDQDAARFYDETLTNYDAIRERQKPQIDPSLQPLAEKVDKLISFTDKQAERIAQYEQREAQELTQRHIQEAATVAKELEKKYPYLADDNYAMVKQMALDATQRNVPFKTVADEFATRMARYETSKSGAAGDGPMLRAGQGSQGIPAAKNTTNTNQPFVSQVRDALNAARKKAS